MVNMMGSTANLLVNPTMSDVNLGTSDAALNPIGIWYCSKCLGARAMTQLSQGAMRFGPLSLAREGLGSTS